MEALHHSKEDIDKTAEKPKTQNHRITKVGSSRPAGVWSNPLLKAEAT